MASAAHPGIPPAPPAGQPLLVVDDVERHFATRQITRRGVRRGLVRALDGVSLTLAAGQTLGIVGESGCGKTTLSRVVLGLLKPTTGQVTIHGENVWRARSPRRRQRLGVQAVFQDPYSSLDPRMQVGEAIGELVACHHPGWGKPTVRERVAGLLTMVGLDPGRASAYPRQLSGGQRQRIGIAKAFAADPDLIVADEPVSALDVSVQAQIVNLLVDLQAETGVSYLLIGHGLALVQHISDQIGVLYLGKLVELGPSRTVLSRPAHHYTAALTAAAPEPAPGTRRRLTVLQGEPASARNVPSGCRFRTRCAHARQLCADQEPPLREMAPGHMAACFFPAS